MHVVIKYIFRERTPTTLYDNIINPSRHTCSTEGFARHLRPTSSPWSLRDQTWKRTRQPRAVCVVCAVAPPPLVGRECHESMRSSWADRLARRAASSWPSFCRSLGSRARRHTPSRRPAAGAERSAERPSSHPAVATTVAARAVARWVAAAAAVAAAVVAALAALASRAARPAGATEAASAAGAALEAAAVVVKRVGAWAAPRVAPVSRERPAVGA